MKKILLLFALFVGLSSCEVADQEPTMQQLVGEFEMTAELGEHLVANLSNRKVQWMDSYDEDWVRVMWLGNGAQTSYFQEDGTFYSFIESAYAPFRQYCRTYSWSYDNNSHSFDIVDQGKYPVVYYKHPKLIIKRDKYFEEYLIYDDEIKLEEYLHSYHRWIGGGWNEVAEVIPGKVFRYGEDWEYSKIYPYGDQGPSARELPEEKAQYIYFAEDGTGIAFSKKTTAEGKIVKYQQPITWKFSVEAPIPGNPDRFDTYLTVNESTYFKIDDAVRKYISSEKQIIGVNFRYVMQTNVTMTGFFDDYDLDLLKAEYCDPQP